MNTVAMNYSTVQYQSVPVCCVNYTGSPPNCDRKLQCYLPVGTAVHMHIHKYKMCWPNSQIANDYEIEI